LEYHINVMKIVGINIKRLRNEKEVSLREFAKKLNVSASFISQVEAGKASPSVATLKAIADELKTTVGELIGENQPVTESPVMRERERKSIKEAGSGIDISMLTARDPNKQMEPLLFTFAENATSGDSVYKHFGQEFVLVLKGVLELSLNDSTYVLKKGDSIYYNSSTPHSFRNIHKGRSEALWVITPPTF